MNSDFSARSKSPHLCVEDGREIKTARERRSRSREKENPNEGNTDRRNRGLSPGRLAVDRKPLIRMEKFLQHNAKYLMMLQDEKKQNSKNVPVTRWAVKQNNHILVD